MALSHAPFQKTTFKAFIKAFPFTSKQVVTFSIKFIFPIALLVFAITKISMIAQLLGPLFIGLCDALGMSYGSGIIASSLAISLVFFGFFLLSQYYQTRNKVILDVITDDRQKLHDYFVAHHLRRSDYDQADPELRRRNGINNHYMYTFWTIYAQISIFFSLIAITKSYTPLKNSVFMGHRLGSFNFEVALIATVLYFVSLILMNLQTNSKKMQALGWGSMIFSSLALLGAISVTTFGFGLYMISVSTFGIIKRLSMSILKKRWVTKLKLATSVIVPYEEILEKYKETK